MTSFTPNLRLHIDESFHVNAWEQGFVSTKAAVAASAKDFKEQALDGTFIFSGAVEWIEDGVVGTYEGIVGATFSRNGIFHLKMVTGDVIAIHLDEDF